MSETNGRSGTSNVRSLTDAIRKARVAESERTDVVVELREAERADGGDVHGAAPLLVRWVRGAFACAGPMVIE